MKANDTLTPDVLTAAGWEETPIKQEGWRIFIKYEKRKFGLPNCFKIKFNIELDSILLEFNDDMRIPISNPISVGELNTFLKIVKLHQFKIQI